MYLLIPGRHHLISSFQHNYLVELIHSKLKGAQLVDGSIVEAEHPITGIVFAVTSANHSGTKRNPIPFYLRAMMLQELSKSFAVPTYVYGIDDVGTLDNFANYTLKQIKHQSEQQLNLGPNNSFVICSTPVLEMYQEMNFKILPAELNDPKTYTYNEALPWSIIEKWIESDKEENSKIKKNIDPATLKIWSTYGLYQKVKNILSDPIIGDDGDITESRDYNTYVRQMDDIAELKFIETSRYIQSGRVGDIGCAVGSWIRQASDHPELRESDFYGIEVARQLFDVCNQRKHNGEFKNPNVFFAQKNAVTSLVFEKESMNTIHTSSLTHEIESYGSRDDLLKFIQNRFAELVPGGVWINRDVIGPVNGEQQILMKLNKNDGNNTEWGMQFSNQEELAKYLNKLSTYARFKRFAIDFRREENDSITYEEVDNEYGHFIKLKYSDAAEFMLTKDYTDNWSSEMHERFCFWSIEDWKAILKQTGFTIDHDTHPYLNPWIEENRFKGKVELFNLNGKSISNPPSNALIIARKTI